MIKVNKKEIDETIEICLIQRFKTNKAINAPTSIFKALNKPKRGGNEKINY